VETADAHFTAKARVFRLDAPFRRFWSLNQRAVSLGVITSAFQLPAISLPRDLAVLTYYIQRSAPLHFFHSLFIATFHIIHHAANTRLGKAIEAFGRTGP
jgi:hypothetical protein